METRKPIEVLAAEVIKELEHSDRFFARTEKRQPQYD
jgi:hypothetical protein